MLKHHPEHQRHTQQIEKKLSLTK